jgi:hypothetical protein
MVEVYHSNRSNTNWTTRGLSEGHCVVEKVPIATRHSQLQRHRNVIQYHVILEKLVLTVLFQDS